MMKPEDIHMILNRQLPGAEVTVSDLTGTMDHFQVDVFWPGFTGKSLIEQHKLVNRALSDALDDGRIHALKIKTYSPKSN